ELLGQFFKEPGCCPVEAAYSTASLNLVNRYFSALSMLPKAAESCRLTRSRWRAFYTALPPCQPLF
ncbi:hypothetical protein, partial [Marinobacter sp. NFXS9]